MNPRAAAAAPLGLSPLPFRPRPATIAPMLASQARHCGAPSITDKGNACPWPASAGACPRHHDADSQRRCTAALRVMTRGKRPDRCRAWPLKGSPVCRAHSAEKVEANRALRQRKREAAIRQAKLQGLRPVRDLLRLFLELLDAEMERPGAGGPVLSRYLRTS